MKVFTYKQYIKYIHTFRLNAVLQVAEESEEYVLERKKESKYSHDKLIKNILKNKEEAVKFINEFIEPQNQLKEEEIERYTNSYITSKYKSKEADVVYRLKNQDVFFLIEHQSTPDSDMPFRMLNYSLDIMREWSMTKKMGKNTYYPIVVPTVIYTGKQKWKMPKNFKEVQYDYQDFERYKIGLAYNYVDIHKLSKNMLFKKDTMFAYSMILEKSESYEELFENLITIIKSTRKKEILEELSNIVAYLLEKVLKENEKQQLLEGIERKAGEVEMSTIERLKREEEEKNRKEGRVEGRVEVARNMLNIKLDEKIILETTKIEKEELEKIKNELAKV